MSKVILVRVIPALLAALLVALLAGCGNSGTAGSAASAVPEDVAVYLSVDTTFQGDQWRAVRDLLAKFPEGEGTVDELLEKAHGGAADSTKDLDEALGPEVGIAVLDIPLGSGEDPSFVLLTQPDDSDAFKKLFEDEGAAFASIGGWEVAAEDEATLARYRQALDGQSLEDSGRLDEAMAGLDDGLVEAYVNGEAILKALTSEQGIPGGAFPLPTGEVGSIGAVLRAEGDGIRVEGRATASVQAEGAFAAQEPYTAELTKRIPDGVLAFLSFNALGEGLAQGAGGFGGFVPFDMNEIAALFGGESAVYVRPGKPEPSVTLVTQVDDETAALRTVEGLLGFVGPAEAKDIAYDAFDGLLVVSTSRAEIAALRGDGARLDQDDSFQDAAAQAGLPDETTGFGYVDLEAIVPLFLGFAPSADDEGAAEAKEYLEPLGSLVFWGGKSGKVQDFSLFLGID
jgi:hypothetical protein